MLELHTRVLSGMHYVIPSITRDTPEDREVLTSTIQIRIRILPMTVEVQSDWMTVQDFATLIVAELNAALTSTVPGTPRLVEETAVSYTIKFIKITIAPLSLVPPLMRSPLLTPVNT